MQRLALRNGCSGREGIGAYELAVRDEPEAA